MTLELEKFPTPEKIKIYSVPADYRSKAHAKIAVACLGAEEGAVEFIRFRGGPPPSGYRTFHSTIINGTTVVSNKRKDRDDDGGFQERKKSKVESKEGERSVPLLETKEEAIARINAEGSSRQNRSRAKKKGNNGGWKKPFALGSGHDAFSRPGQGSSIGQIPRNRSAGSTPKHHKSGGPQPQRPPAPPKAGPAMLGIYDNPSLQEHPVEVGSQQDHLMHCPPVPRFPPVGSYPPVSYIHPPPPGYFPSHGSNIPYGQSALPPQYHGAGPAPPFPYIGTQFSQQSHYAPPPSPVPPHVYQSQYSSHSLSSGHLPTGPPVLGYDNAPYVSTLAGNLAQPSYHVHNQHQTPNPPASVFARAHGTNEIERDFTTEVSVNTRQLHESKRQRDTPTPPLKSHATSLFGTFTSHRCLLGSADFTAIYRLLQ